MKLWSIKEAMERLRQAISPGPGLKAQMRPRGRQKRHGRIDAPGVFATSRRIRRHLR